MLNKNEGKLLYEDLSYIIRGVCFDLYKQFGGVFKESVIDKALKKELELKGLKVETQKKINILYKDEKIGLYIPDIIVEGKILIELKAKSFLTKEDERQFWYYLKASEYKLGFLINFGSRELQIKRRIYDKARENIRVNLLLQRKYPRQSVSTNGFTTIEVLVSMTLFAIIVSVATVSFVTAMRTQRQLVNLMAVTDSASLTIEQMAKEIRTGRDFCLTPCADGEIIFATWQGESVTYKLDSDKRLTRNSQPITADNVSIERLNFIISGNQPTDNYPPRITIILRAAVPQTGPIGIRGVHTDLQTTVSARNPE